jgi:uncharacterized protein (DUF1499 family)
MSLKLRFWLSCLVAPLLWGCTGTRPGDLGLTDGQLKPCPPTPNCVSSQATDAEHRIEPLASQGPDGIAQIAALVQTLPRAAIRKQSESYLYVEFTSFLLRFVDDVEFYQPQQGDTIEVRSASRLGRLDLGVNRKRVEQIRLLLRESKVP